MDINVYNTKYPVMNPPDLNVMWMGHFAPERPIIIEDNQNIYNQTGLMDDLTQQTHAMDMNPMMGLIGGEFHPVGTTLAPSSSITPDLYGLHVTQSSQTTSLDNYNDENTYDGEEHDGNNLLENIQQDHSQVEYFDETENTEYDYDYDSFIPKNTIATQTHQEKDGYKKILPIKRPGLVLKTPIAYQGDIDPSVIPIQRDGMAVCLRCGAIGVKHSFYTKERRYCSMACARGFNTTVIGNQKQKQEKMMKQEDTIDDNSDVEIKENVTFRFKMGNISDDSPMLYRDLIPLEEVPQIPKPNRLPSPCPQDEKIETVRRRPSEINSYDWSAKLNEPNFIAAPVTCFKHAPGYEVWLNIGIGMKVEVENTDCDNNEDATGFIPHSFWVGTVLKICGYKALIRYEGFDRDPSHDFWVNLCTAEVHPVGWCATRGKPLIPPKSIENKYKDWKQFLVKRLSGARTLPSTFYNKINDSSKSRFRCGLHLEVVDKNRISQVKLALVHRIVGKRLFVKYFDSDSSDGFWCHEDSPLIHPVGWAAAVGHNLAAPTDYLERMQGGHEQLIETLEDDATIDLFKMNFSFEEHYLEERKQGFLEGMKLEAIDPLNLSSICVATVMAVLKFGYMMIRIDTYDPDVTGADWFCYHEKSPCIFPVGFCEANNIQLTPPKDYTPDTFNWNEYLRETNSPAASHNLFAREIPKHGFMEGMKLECADLMDPKLVCVATISRLVGRLLKVHFDGWGDEYDQWLDCESPDIYPVGWCDMVLHKLEGPPPIPQPIVIKPKPKTSPKPLRRGKKQTKGKKAKIDPTFCSAKKYSKKLQENIDTYEQDKSSDFVLSQESFNEPMLDRVKIEAKQEPYDFDTIESESFSSEQTSPSSIRSELKFCIGDERFKGSNPSSISPSAQQPPPPPPTAEVRPITPTKPNSPINIVKYIPRLLDSNNSPENGNGTSNGNSNTNSNGSHINELLPDQWDNSDVAQFLNINECAPYSDTFIRNNVDGKRLLELTKDEIIEMLGMKVGPALKIFDLLQQLKCKIDPIQSRKMKANLNKKFL